MTSKYIHRLLLIATLALMPVTAPPSLAGERPSMEYSVKAAMIYNMAKFVEWPDAQANDRGEFHICVIGEDPFGRSLYALEGKTIKGRTVKVHKFDTAHKAGECHIIFLDGSYAGDIDEALALLADRPSLVISDIDGFVSIGGDIGFIIVDNKVRFEINNSSVGRKKLKVSSRLLKLADKVVEGGNGP